MKFTPPRSKATFLVLLVLTLTQMAAHAQRPQSVGSKLDALLAARVREGDSGTQRVIIRTTSNGIPGLTTRVGEGWSSGASPSSEHQCADGSRACCGARRPLP